MKYVCIGVICIYVRVYICTYISLSCLMAVHGGKSLQASGVRNENSYEQPCKPINSGWAFCGKKKYKNLNPISKEEEMNKQKTHTSNIPIKRS